MAATSAARGDAGLTASAPKPGQKLSHPPSTTVPVPLAHPHDINRSDDYSQPTVAISFATSKPGEDVADFQARIVSRGIWGQPGRGRHGVEIVLTRESAEALIGLLAPAVGRQRVVEIIDSP